jgi:hypothetical protein
MSAPSRGDGSRTGDYRVARIGTAFGLTAVLIVLMVLDALSADYSLDTVQLVVLVGAILTLLGLEARDMVRVGRL